MEKFYLGMDIGTESVGMACTDENYNLLRAKGKHCWAVRLFDESQTAVDRRTQRTARRRLERRKFRIGMLQYLFSEYIEDKTFFLRLNNSAYYKEDKDAKLNGAKNSLFSDPAFRDKDYHGRFPTVFHLRKYLQTENCTDLRLYYLALHHIIKYRGHFLFEGGMEDVRNIGNLYLSLNAVLDALFDEDKVAFDISKAEQSKQILMSALRKKQKELETLFDISSPRGKEVIKGICGSPFSPKVLFDERYQEEDKIDFKKLNDETFEALRTVYEDDFALLERMRAIYNFINFEKLLEGQPDISSAMIALYDKHRDDLQRFKNFLRVNADKDTYNKMFSDSKEQNNYLHYAGHCSKKGIYIKRCDYESFIKYTKHFLESLDKSLCQTEDYLYFQQEITNKTFLPLILHADNGLFPHQVNEDELNKIVAKMVENFPQTEKIAKKIKDTFRFRVPYYVGPLTGCHGWAVRNNGMEKVPVTPWNFDEVIDKSASNEAFMRNMTAKCSYLHTEDVLPKCSIYYQKYNVLNQINKLKVNDVPLTVQQKKLIFDKLFLTHVRVSDKTIINLLTEEGYIPNAERKTAILSGKDEEVTANMASYIQLKKILGDFVDNNMDICENIILWHTLNTDKSLVEKLLIKNYGKIPEIRNNIPRLKGLSFRDFGRFSKKFLTETGEAGSILDLLYDTNENLNEILFNEKYGFQQLLAEENGTDGKEVTYKDIEELYVSPAVRRGIYQSFKMVDEYVQAIGKTPDKIFVEVTRQDGEKGDKGRKYSRKKQLLDLYSHMDGIEELKEQLNEKTESDLRSERWFLYFRQLGKCMYSGTEIDLGQLTTDMYDVDHILPRAYIKDDSLDNKVLVLREKNATKTDIYPIPQGLVTQTARNHWEILRKKGLLSDVTYHRLTRTAPLTDDDYQGFINRQKVITDQTAKAVLELMKKKFPDTKIVYSKAVNVSDFKKDFSLYKCRETNDLHHARDAYLNVVVGNVYDTRFSTPWGGCYQKDDAWRLYNLKYLFLRNVKGAWVADNNETLYIVKNTFAKTSMTVTRYAFCNKGEFYKQTVYDHTDSGITAPKKSGTALRDTSKYGGYKTQTTAHFAIVQSEDKKGQTIKTFEAIPVLVTYQQKNNPNAVEEYLRSYLNNPVILVPKVKIKQAFRYNGTPVYIAGVTGNSILVHNAVELFSDNKTDNYVNGLTKVTEMAKSEYFNKEKEEYIIHINRFKKIQLNVCRERNIELYDFLLQKLSEKTYQGLSGMRTFAKGLQTYRDKFLEISTYLQAETLLQILKFFKCNAETSNMTNIGGSGISGKLLINKDITDAEVVLLFYSPSGLTVREKKV